MCNRYHSLITHVPIGNIFEFRKCTLILQRPVTNRPFARWPPDGSPRHSILSSIICQCNNGRGIFRVVAGTILKPLNGGLPSQRSVGYGSMSDNLRTLLKNRKFFIIILLYDLPRRIALERNTKFFLDTCLWQLGVTRTVWENDDRWMKNNPANIRNCRSIRENPQWETNEILFFERTLLLYPIKIAESW